MKKLLFVALLAAAGSAQAQINITSTDMPVVNDTLRYSQTAVSVDVTLTGANKTWNYGTLKAEHQDMEHYYSPTQTPYLLQFTLNSTYGVAEPNTGAAAGVGALASNIYGFYKNSATANVMTGRGATIQSLPLGIVYSQKDTIYKFPLSFGASYSSDFAGSASLLTLGSLNQSGTRSTMVDGWGKITTPYGTFDCIRVKTVITETDSIVFQGTGIPIPNNRTEYRWLAKNQHFPILEVVVPEGFGAGTQTVRYRDTYRPEAYVNNADFFASTNVAQLTDTVTFTDQSWGVPKTYAWTITPSSFRYVGGTNAGSASPQVMFDAHGAYSVKLAVTYEGGADDTLKTNFINVGDPVKADFSATPQVTSVDELVYFSDQSSGPPDTWDWIISPATFSYVAGTGSTSKNPIVVFHANGNYDVQLSVSGPTGADLIAKKMFIAINPVGINTVSGITHFVKVYPNPGKELLTLQFAQATDADVQLNNLLGQTVMNIKLAHAMDQVLNIGTLPKGIYILNITTGSQHYMERVVVE